MFTLVKAPQKQWSRLKIILRQLLCCARVDLGDI